MPFQSNRSVGAFPQPVKAGPSREFRRFGEGLDLSRAERHEMKGASAAEVGFLCGIGRRRTSDFCELHLESRAPSCGRMDGAIASAAEAHGDACAYETESLDLDIWNGLRRVCARRQGRFRQPGQRNNRRDPRSDCRVLRGLGTTTSSRTGPPALTCLASAARNPEFHHTS